MQLREYENQTLEAFVAARHLYTKFDCPVAHQKVSLLVTVHDFETGYYIFKTGQRKVGSWGV